MSETQLQHSHSSRASRYSDRLALWARRGGIWLGRVPAGFWRFCVKLLIVIWLAYTLAQLVWFLVPDPEVPEARVAANAAIQDGGGGETREVDIAALAELDIFGRAPEGEETDLLDEELNDSEAAAGIEDEAVDTDLDLVLHGIMGSSREQSARAIIADGKDQDIYAPGDELPVSGRVTLEKVLPLRVILNNAGRYESLWLYGEGDWSSDLASSQPVPETPGRSWEEDEAQERDASGRGGGSAQAGSDPEETVDEEEAEQAAEEVADRMGADSLSDVVSMSIHREDGQIVGYRIRPGRNSEMFDSLGLQSDDVVKAVNGVELTSPQRVMEIYRDMGDARSASLLIDRGGEEVSIDIDLE